MPDLAARFFADVAEPPATTSLRVDVPTLVLWGMQDPVCLPGLLDNLHDYAPNATVVRIEDHSARLIPGLRQPWPQPRRLRCTPGVNDAGECRARRARLPRPGDQAGCPRLIRLGQRQRAIAGSADVISRNHCPSPTRVMFNPPSALPALTFEASHAAGSGSVRSVTPLSQRADATRVERACVIELTLLGLSIS